MGISVVRTQGSISRKLRSQANILLNPSGLSTMGGMRWVDIALSLDRATHSLGLSKPVLFVSGFWRSGTTWLQEYLASGFHAKTIFEPLSPLIEARDLMLREGF